MTCFQLPTLALTLSLPLPVFLEQLLETNQRVRELTMQLTSLEDQLSATRLEASKLRTEATTERSSWEIRVHDLQTKINEVRARKGRRPVGGEEDGGEGSRLVGRVEAGEVGGTGRMNAK